MKHNTRWIAALVLAAGLPVASQAVELRDTFTRAIEEGNAAYEAEDYTRALGLYNDAILQQPDSYVAMINRGLAQGRLGDFEAALRDFRDASAFAGDNEKYQAYAAYNGGRAHLGLANSLSGLPDTQAPESGANPEEALRHAITAMRAFDEALSLDPDLEDAEFNRAQAQHLIEQIALQQQQQQQQGGSSESGEDNQGEGEEDSPQNPSSGDEQQRSEDESSSDQQDQNAPQEGDENEQSQDQQGQQNEGDPQQDQQQGGEGSENQQQQQDQQNQEGQGEQQEQEGPPEGEYREQPEGDGQEDEGENEQQGNEQQQGQQQSQPGEPDGEQQQGGEAQMVPQGDPREMTPEEAERFLNLLGSREILVRRLPPKWRNTDRSKKNW